MFRVLFCLLALAGGVYADDTSTPTYTITNTFTASPTITPTRTVTPSFSVSPTSSYTKTVTDTRTITDTRTATMTFSASPTYTATPTFTMTATLTFTKTQIPTVLRKGSTRKVFKVMDFKASNSISAPELTPAAGGAWAEKASNIAVLAMAKPTPDTEPQVRFRWVVPADYQPWPFPMKLWATGVCSDVGTDNTICVNTYRMKRANKATNYTNIETLLGVTTNVQTQPSAYSLSQGTTTAKRFLLTAPVAISQCVAGDELEFQVIRAAGAGTLRFHTIEVEYDRKNFLNP